ncbi:MAG: hypothetical protein FWC39_02975 [Bacteroidetes bacterium]|nr:hypothetical protein [Bacteroidota bacterium]
MKTPCLAITTLCLFFTTVAYSQCKTFAKTECKQQLAPFAHDGIFNVSELSEGESTEFTKTFYANQNYRIALCSQSQLPKIKLTVMDSDRNVLFSNIDQNYATVWDFKTEASQRLIISVEVETVDDKVSGEIARGCVALLVGKKPLPTSP